MNTEIPDFLPPPPPIPEGFSRWEYRGKDWRCDDGPATTYACASSAEWAAETGYPHEWAVREDRWPEGMGFYIEAVRDSNCLEGPGRTPEEMAENFRELNKVAPTAAEKLMLMTGNLRPTPETDDRTFHRDSGEYGMVDYVVDADFARHIERQRDELLEALKRIAPRTGDKWARDACEDAIASWAD